MRNHTYQITVEYLEDAGGNPVDGRAFSFLAANRDEISAIVDRIRASRQFAGDEAAAFAVGIKRFGEVMLKNKHHPLFTDFRLHFMDFMKRLKASPQKAG